MGTGIVRCALKAALFVTTVQTLLFAIAFKNLGDTFQIRFALKFVFGTSVLAKQFVASYFEIEEKELSKKLLTYLKLSSF